MYNISIQWNISNQGLLDDQKEMKRTTHTFIINLLTVCYMPVALLDIRTTAVNKTDKMGVSVFQ